MNPIYIKNSASGFNIASAVTSVKEVWLWGADNMLPDALGALNRSSVTHRRILQDKADYISGHGFKCDSPSLADFCKCCNSLTQSLRAVIQRVALDKCLFGNAVIEVVIKGKSLSLFHQDASRARLSRDKRSLIFHHNWAQYRATESESLPIFPIFEKQADGTMRSAIFYKDYEPTFENYGVPKYIAALGAIAIAHKTDKWNISRLDNAFQLSGVMILDGAVDSADQAAQIAAQAEQRFKGNPGQVMFLVKDGAEQADSSKFIPIDAASDGDWRTLHEQSTADIIVAHSWFRTLSGLEYTTGFSADRVKNEYNIALNSIICAEQQEIIEPIKQLFKNNVGINADDLSFVNTPPFETKAPYMRVWEARKIDGLEYNQNDKSQQQFLTDL